MSTKPYQTPDGLYEIASSGDEDSEKSLLAQLNQKQASEFGFKQNLPETEPGYVILDDNSARLLLGLDLREFQHVRKDIDNMQCGNLWQWSVDGLRHEIRSQISSEIFDEAILLQQQTNAVELLCEKFSEVGDHVLKLCVASLNDNKELRDSSIKQIEKHDIRIDFLCDENGDISGESVRRFVNHLAKTCPAYFNNIAKGKTLDTNKKTPNPL